MAKHKYEIPNEPPKAMAEAWEDFKAEFVKSLEPILIPPIRWLTRLINWYIRWVDSHAK